jgi:peptidyl-prolyl cis-trans isomerase SurA
MSRTPMIGMLSKTRKNTAALRSLMLPLACALLALLAMPARATVELVDHVVAAVNNEVITASELSQVIALNRLSGGTAGEDPAALRSQTLDGLITRRLLVQEARRLRFVDVSEEEIAAEIEQLKKRFPSEAAYTSFLRTQDMTEQELGRMLGERLLVERFVEKKVGLFVRVSRDEAQEYFDAHAAEFRGKRFPDVQKAITALLLDQKIGRQIDQYVAELRAKADIRINPQPRQ